MAAIEVPLRSPQACTNNKYNPKGTYHCTEYFFADRKIHRHTSEYRSENPLKSFSLFELVKDVYNDSFRKPDEDLQFNPLPKNSLVALTIHRACMRQEIHRDGVRDQRLRAERVAAFFFVDNVDLVLPASYTPTAEKRRTDAIERGEILTGTPLMRIENPTGKQLVKALHIDVTRHEAIERPVRFVTPSFVQGRYAESAYIGLPGYDDGQPPIAQRITREELKDTITSLF